MIDIAHEVDGLAVEKVSKSVYLLRGYADGNKYPGKFEWVALAIVSGGVATMKGFLHINSGGVSLKHARLVNEFLLSIGCKILFYQRIKDGVVINVTRRL
jgi:hypothetical protein